MEDYGEHQGHHHKDLVVIFSENDTGVDPLTEHIGCQVQVEAGVLSGDDNSYTSGSESETEATKAKVLRQLISKILRQSKDGRK